MTAQPDLNQLHVQPLFDYGVPVVTLVLLTTVGLDLRPADFARVRDQPLMVAVGVLAPPLLLPSVAVGLIAWLRPAPVLASGLLLLACCPAGGISNTYSYLARASVALAVTLTSVSCALAVITIPATAFVVERLWQHAMPVAVPFRTLAGQVLFIIALPIGTGMAIRARWPAFAERWNPALQKLGFLLLAALLALTFSGSLGAAPLDLASGAVLAVAFTVAAFALGGTAALLVGGGPADRFTLSTEFATRNVAVATALALSLGGLDLALFGALYFVCEAPILLVAAFVFRRRFALVALATAALAALATEASAAVHSGLDGQVRVPVPRIDARIEVDGVLDEAPWLQAAVLSGFSQYAPVDGRPAVDQTEVLVWYGPAAIHFGIRAHAAPGSVHATLADRDRIDGDDHVQIYLSTFDDGREALMFAVNPLQAWARPRREPVRHDAR